MGFQLAGFILGVAAILSWAADRTGVDYLRAAWPIWLLGLVVWAWLSTLWSPYEAALFGGNASTLLGMVIALIFVPSLFLRLSGKSREALIWAVIGAGFLGVSLLFIDSVSGYALSLWGSPVAPGGDPIQRLSDAEMNLGRGQVSYAQFFWPVAALLIVKFKRGWILALAAFLCLIVSAQLNNLFIVIPTLLLAGGFAALAWWRPRLGLILAFALAIASIALAPLLGVASSWVDVEVMRKIPLSWEHRLRMWTYSWELIQQAPFVGHGFDSARAYETLKFRAPDGRDITVMSMHPHNIGLHIWLETGLIGVLMTIGWLLAMLKMTLKHILSPVRAFAVTGLVVTIATSGAVTVGVWQHWWWGLIVLVGSLIIIVPSRTEKLDELNMSIT